MKLHDRRSFLKFSVLSIIPATLPGITTMAGSKKKYTPPSNIIKLYGDGEMFDASGYISLLQQINTSSPIEKDGYGEGGAVQVLEKKFAALTGKEKAIFMPTGTMANQFAIAVLSGENTKVFVQETSHVYRDEADAAQSVFSKRLIPLAKGETFFTADELQQSIDYHNKGEVFRSGMGTVSIENPVRRSDGRMIPFDELKRVCDLCRKNNLKLHLDGARIHMASAWSGVNVSQYASLFDTIYISLYKYLGAASGAMLCGEKQVIDKMRHLMKIHGGTMFGNWANAAMALHRLEGIDERLKRTIRAATQIIEELNQTGSLNVSQLQNGTNIYKLKVDKVYDGKKMAGLLNKEHSIQMSSPNAENECRITINETLLYRDSVSIINSFKRSLQGSKL